MERAGCPVLVGREDQLAALDDALLDVVAGDARVVLLSGDAGLGKTRLATELAGHARRLGCTVLWGGCSEAALAVPYLPFVQAFGNHIAQADVAVLRNRLGAGARELARLFPQLTLDPGVLLHDDPGQGKLRLFEAVVALLGAVAGDGPVLLVAEDVHWADGSTHELLDYLVRRLAGSPVLLLVTYRPEEIHRGHPLHPTLQTWQRSRVAHSVALESLRPPQVAEMIGAILDEPSVSIEFRDYLHRRSDGSPFVVEEMLREAMERGDVFRAESGWSRKSIVELGIPETVRDTILSRLERLGPVQRDVLRKAAVIGVAFDMDVLAELCDLDADGMDDVLRACARERFVEEVPDRPTDFRFHHSVTRETVYADVAPPQRLRIHERIAAIMERRGAPAALRAVHLTGAGHVADAVPLWIEAARDVVDRYAYADAAELYERALAHIGDPVLRARTQAAAGYVLWGAGGTHIAAAIRHLEECVATLEAAGLQREAASHRLLLGRCYWMLSEGPAARRQFTCAVEVLEPFGVSEELANAYLRLGGQEAIDCHWEAAERLLQRAIDIATELHADEIRIGASLMIAAPVLERDIAAGLELYDRACREAIDRDLDLLAANALGNSIIAQLDLLGARDCLPLLDSLHARHDGNWTARAQGLEGAVHLYLGNVAEAIRILSADPLPSAPGDRFQRDLDKFLGLAFAVAGRTQDAMRHAVRPERARGDQDVVFLTMAWLRVHIACGTPEEALPAVDDLLDRFDGLPPWRVHGPHELADGVVAVLVASGQLDRATAVAAEVEERRLTWSPYGMRARARALLARRDAGAAASLLRASLAGFDAAGYRLDVAETRALLASALQATGDSSSAQHEAALALSGATACGAPYIVEMARACLGEAGGTTSHAQVAQPPDASSGSVVVVGLAGGESAEAVLRWGVHRGEALGGETATEPGGVRVRFDATHCLDAVRFAVMLHDKALLAESCVDVGAGVTTAQAHRIASTRDALLSDDVQRLLQPSLTARRAGPDGAYTLSHRVVTDVEALPTANVFRRDGEYWTVARGAAVIRIRDSKGMRDLAALLARPGCEVAAVELLAAGSGPLRVGDHAALGLGREGDAGPVLDDEARRQYRERLAELDAEIEDAETAHDPERASRAIDERDQLLEQLGAAFGLGGRSRRVLDPVERARKTVTWRIRDAIARIAAADARIGDHLHRTVRTGTFCVYDPPEPPGWEL